MLAHPGVALGVQIQKALCGRREEAARHSACERLKASVADLVCLEGRELDVHCRAPFFPLRMEKLSCQRASVDDKP